jgi:hypothetical protein
MCRLGFRHAARIIACVVGLAILINGRAASADTLYKFSGGALNFSPYPDGLLALTISDGTVTGQLRPLLGDNTPPVTVNGTNPKDGIIELTFSLPSGPKKYTFSKRIQGQRITWNMEREGLSFYRYMASSLSDAALTLSDHECGAAYKSLEAEFKPGVTIARLESFLATDRDVSALPVAYDAGSDARDRPVRKTTDLGSRLKQGLKATSEAFLFHAPVGVEPYIVKWLRQSGLFKKADLDSGGCGGADRSYFVVNRGLLFDGNGFSQPKFEQYIATRLQEFASKDERGNMWQFRLGQPRVSRINVPPYPSSYRLRMYTASEITRHVPGWWDAFSVSFEPGELLDTKNTEYAVVVTVERLKASKKSPGNSTPPDDAYFSKELSDSDEAEVTAAISRYFSRRDGGWCVFDREGYEAEKHHSVCNDWSAR